ncbi:MAG TPA: 50S ribosomal protein L4 [Rhabdochlamydiaceae bacterium]|nr:50S ribosomal protein L4 [Rhabdochlamydiaceae bacterium]
MADIKKFDLTGKEKGQVTVKNEVLERGANSQMIKDYIVALRANARQWSAHTKSRSEVSHSGQKPHPQKGTGRARQGYLGAPQYKGGGRVGGPRAKFDQHVSINRKEKRAAIRFLLAEKIQNDNLIILEDEAFKAPKTKKVADFLKGRELFGKKVLIIGNLTEKPSQTSKKRTSKKEASKKDVNFLKSLRNIPRAAYIVLDNVSGYDILAHRNIILMEPAVDKLMKILES